MLTLHQYEDRGRHRQPAARCCGGAQHSFDTGRGCRTIVTKGALASLQTLTLLPRDSASFHPLGLLLRLSTGRQGCGEMRSGLMITRRDDVPFVPHSQGAAGERH
jgi:hypothetical protein